MEEPLLEKELNDVHTAIKELMQEKEGELNINTKIPFTKNKGRKTVTNKSIRDILKMIKEKREKEDYKKEIEDNSDKIDEENEEIEKEDVIEKPEEKEEEIKTDDNKENQNNSLSLKENNEKEENENKLSNFDRLNSENNDKMIELQISPIDDKEKKIFNKNEPFGDLSDIIKKNILAQNKKQKK